MVTELTDEDCADDSTIAERLESLNVTMAALCRHAEVIANAIRTLREGRGVSTTEGPSTYFHTVLQQQQCGHEASQPSATEAPQQEATVSDGGESLPVADIKNPLEEAVFERWPGLVEV